MGQTTVNIDYIRHVNYALYHNKVDICQLAEITNDSDRMLSEVEVTCDGDFIATFKSALPFINSHETVRIADFCIAPIAGKLAEITEKITTSFCVRVTACEEIVFQQDFELTLMPFDQWQGLSILPQTLVSFVTPNHPSISNLIVQAAAVLKDLTGSSCFHAYMTDNVNDVRMQLAAIYAAIHEQGIIYRSLPASFEEVGQRVSLPNQVLTSKLGNCIELTLLFATALEAVGINSGIVLQKGHAYLCVWLVDDSCPYSICDDPSYIEKKCSRGIDEMLVLETTMTTHENTSFESAVLAASQHLADHSKFEMMLDVKRCRLERFLPLPLRVDADGQWNIETNGVEHDQCLVDVQQHDRYDLSHLRESKQELSKFDIWERKLLDFSLRNSLLNLYLRRKAIQFISFDVDKIEDHLQDGEEYVIEARPEVELKIESDERLTRSKLLEPLHELISSDIEHHRLHSYQTEQETQQVLKNIYRAARNAIEETGANSLFLTIGALRWYETPLSETPRFAPILLLPVEMIYKKGKYYIRTREEDITLNITLIEFLRQNYDIRIDSLNQLPADDHGVDVSLIFAILRDALKDQKRWDVEEECLLGTFSFSKFLMWYDVHNNRDRLKENDIVRSLVENRLTWSPQPLTTQLMEADQTMAPADLALPVDVDSSQMSAIIEGGKGNSFILYGPPGTGKSQTITNLIANALYQGKRVLFVAEKMAALSVVQSRLAKIGLDPFCLELHSNKATKRHVLEQLDKALKVAHIMSPADFSTTADKIFEKRKALIGYMNALHTVDPADGLSLHDCIVRYEAIDGHELTPYEHDRSIDAFMSEEGISGVEELMGDKLDAIIRLVGQPSAHPLLGLRLNLNMIISTDETISKIDHARQTLLDAIGHYDSLKTAKDLRTTLLRDNDARIFDLDARQLYDEWRSIRIKWFLPKFFAKRSFIARLRQYNHYVTEADIDTLLDNLMTYSQMHRQISEVRTVTESYDLIAAPQPDADDIPSTDQLTAAAQRLACWIDHASLMHDWLHWSDYRDELIGKGLTSVVKALERNQTPPAELRSSFLKALFRHKCETKIKASATLVAFEGMMFDELVKEYKKLTQQFQILTQKELYAKLAAKVPRVTDNIDNSSEIGLLNRNVSNGGRGLSLRELFEQIPTLLPRLCPCMLMSPMSVAQYLDLSQEKFDLVVFDEASQMPTSEAVGAIARGKSLIVVGDPKQMPPTSFFSSTNVDEDEAALDDMESILEDCRTLDVPSLQLNWHYRSRHESLIAFSNNEYYDSSLITFPSADDQHTKVQHIPVEGFYDKGGRRSNRAEAEAIVSEITRRLRDPQLAKQSIGVIAFSVVQQSLIEDLLQDVMDADKMLRETADGMYEPIFVKNLENVQGDERDVILFSIGYGPDKEGKVSMNFGPLNNAGGERRLNVAVSRARQEMLVFSTLKASQIDLRRSKARGVEGLKHFLEYAESQTLATSSGTNTVHKDSRIAEQIAQALSEKGYKVKTGIGRSQFKVDIAVCDGTSTDVYKLGILLDGEGYRDTQTTRDREIVQPSVLTSLRWNVMRVWSVDWFNNRQRVLSRIIERLDATPDAPLPPEPVPVFDPSTEKLEETSFIVRKYQEYSAAQSTALKMSDSALAHKIVDKEQPICFSLLCRRVSQLRGIARVTPTLQRELGAIVTTEFHTEDERGGMVVWNTVTDFDNYPWYRPDSGRDVTEIPMVEIRNAVREAIAEQFSLQRDSLTLIAAKKLGFTRRGANVDAAVNEAIDQLITRGEVEESDGKLKIRS